MDDGRWRNPGDDVMRELMPWFEDPLDFLTGIDWMRRENAGLLRLTADPRSAYLFRQARGSTAVGPVKLPWLDVEQAVLIAVNRRPGDDVAMALDYRTGSDDPRVVASDFWTDPRQCSWRIVVPAFSRLLDVLNLG
ncbi:hypothetical protein [Catellatospora sp. TT07R-123]|uniref:hypothetical protein n=1 Tax=Catellatospora sp. TT07R-123 TaxID=2733863 RepID=UPI001FD21E86|nr:hypothetical protein [Catellatospora sp. TT07R-123]